MKILTYIFVGLLTFSTMFISLDIFVSPEIITKWYILGSCVLLGALLFLIARSKIFIKLDKLSLFIIVFVGYLIIRTVFSDSYTSTVLIYFFCFLILYLFLRSLDGSYNKPIAIIIVAICALESIYGLLQAIGIIKHYLGFRIVGSFDNPAGYAACISVGIPFCILLINEKSRLKYIGILASILIVLGVVMSESRAGILSIIVFAGCFIAHKYKHLFRNKAITAISSVIILFLIITGLFLFKKDSATGRLLVWNITTGMIAEAPLFGSGYGSFKADYMEHQAAFFENDPDNKYSLLADNITHPFNEYLFLSVEYGVVGLVLLGLIFICILLSLKKSDNVVYSLCVVSIVVFAFFSYPLRYPFIVVVLAYCFAQIRAGKEYSIQLKAVVRSGVIAAVCACSYLLIKDIRFESKWKELVRQTTLGRTRKVISEYENLYDHWNWNPFFLYNYGANLNRIEEYQKSLDILSECQRYFNDYDVQMIIADNYLHLNDIDSAESHYKKASHMIPCRFMPLYKLLEIYKSTNQDAAINLAEEILAKPIKVPSSMINNIKQKANVVIKAKPITK